MQTIDYRIPAGKEILACSVDYADKVRIPSVICLHGGGPTSRHSTEYLAKALQSSGRTVIRFDFSGQGDSTGKMAESSQLFDSGRTYKFDQLNANRISDGIGRATEDIITGVMTAEEAMEAFATSILESVGEEGAKRA